MKAAFVVIAAAMILCALLLLVVPLWRRRGDHASHARPLAVLLAVAVPLLAGAIYWHLGQPSTLNGVPHEDPAQIQLAQALNKLETHLQQNPKDTQGWLLLGQTMVAVQQPAAALDAYQHALDNAATNPIALVGWAEMSAMTRPDHQFSDLARQRLQQALSTDPGNQRALWLLGISDYQRGQYAAAIHDWQTLQPLLPAGSEIAKVVQNQLQDARQQWQGAAPAASAAAPAREPQVQVQIRLSPALQAQVRPGDTLFVYARALSGPPMPLAVTRLPASALPARVTLTEAMAMLPQHDLASARQIIVGARISHHGQALPAPGDLQGETPALSLPARAPVDVVIDKVD